MKELKPDDENIWLFEQYGRQVDEEGRAEGNILSPGNLRGARAAASPGAQSFELTPPPRSMRNPTDESTSNQKEIPVIELLRMNENSYVKIIQAERLYNQ